MFPFTIFITPLSVFLSLSTATGVVVHDTKIDKATMTAITSPVTSSGNQVSTKLTNIAPELHTHTERHSMNQSGNDLKSANPKIQPRSNGDKKYISQKNMGLGHNPFDSYGMPLIN